VCRFGWEISFGDYLDLFIIFCCVDFLLLKLIFVYINKYKIIKKIL
jgi:hypothetical protein